MNRLLLIGLTSLVSCTTLETPDFTQYVHQEIGTAEHGHVFLGANVPFGMVQVGPSNYSQGWDWCSGYHQSDSLIVGFSHTHLSGTGIGDLGDIAFMPVVGDVKRERGENTDANTGIFSKYSHSSESYSPGYYSVILERFNIQCEMTATKRAAIHRYTFLNNPEDARLIVDLVKGIGWDGPVQGHIEQLSERSICGYRFSRGWANNQKVYFVAEFSEPIRAMALGDEINLTTTDSLTARRLYADIQFGKLTHPLLVKVGISPVSCANAQANLTAEIPDFSFDQVAQNAKQEWNAQLGKIQVEGDSLDCIKFYTAFYHTMIAPSVYSDINGEYRGADYDIHTAKGFTNYTTFSLWDTYRALHPMLTITHPQMCRDIAETFLAINEQGGQLPVWHLWSNETWCMVGNPAVPVLADIVLKNLTTRPQACYEAMKATMQKEGRGLALYNRYGYIPYTDGPGAVARGLEYALADWSLAQVAHQLGETGDENFFATRAHNYVNYFDPITRFMRGKDSLGNFRSDFNPFVSDHFNSDYTEGNAWQYSWLVPQDALGLAELFGGVEPFIAKLDSLFVVSGDMGENASPDISGLIGQYAHGNEPSHHVVYLYSALGYPQKAAFHARQIMNTLYTTRPDGICGNEDVGQMSAWYVLSSMGFYQMEPCGGRYYFGSPIFKKVTLNLEDGKQFTVIAHNNAKDHCYIESILLNGTPYDKPYIDYATIMKGGTLEFTMTNQEN